MTRQLRTSLRDNTLLPNTISVPSIMTICPRRWDLEVSDCQVGTVEVFMPFEECVSADYVVATSFLTISEASDESRCDELPQAERGSLNCCADDHDAASDEDRLLTAEDIA